MKAALKLLGWCLLTVIVMLLSLTMAKRRLPFEFANISLLAPILVLAFTYFFARRKMRLGEYPRTLIEIFPPALFTLGYAASILCFHLHLCMDGHMAHPTLISNLDYYLDWAWAACLVSSAYMALRERSRFAFITCSLVIFVLIYRFVLQSFGGQFTIPI